MKHDLEVKPSEDYEKYIERYNELCSYMRIGANHLKEAVELLVKMSVLEVRHDWLERYLERGLA